jgi:phage tail-like protein
MPTRRDPYVNFNFLVEIDGITHAAFQEAGGLDTTIEVIEHREGGENITTRKYPGQVKFSNITLKRGLTDDVELYGWHKQWADGDPAAPRKNGSIVLLDRQGQEKARWNFFNGWPSKWTGPALNAEQNDIAIESLEIAHEGLARA